MKLKAHYMQQFFALQDFYIIISVNDCLVF